MRYWSEYFWAAIQFRKPFGISDFFLTGLTVESADMVLHVLNSTYAGSFPVKKRSEEFVFYVWYVTFVMSGKQILRIEDRN